MVYDYTIHIANDNTTHSKILSMIGRDKTVLEIGCATGYMTRFMKEELGCHVYGIEIDPEAAEAARPFCQEIVKGDIETLDLVRIFSLRRFDVIVMADVLEHLKDAGKLLALLPGLLTTGGFILLSLPNGAHGSIGLEILDGRWQYRQLGLLDRTHLHFFDKDAITILLDEAGFYISRLQRVLIHPRDTEMKTPWDSYPRDVTAYLEKVNPEFQTYQFVIKACPTDEQGGRAGLEDSRRAETERADRLENQLTETSKELSSLKALLADGHESEFMKITKEYRDNLQKEQQRLEREIAEVHKGYQKHLVGLNDERRDFQLDAVHYRRQTQKLAGELTHTNGIIQQYDAHLASKENELNEARRAINGLWETIADLQGQLSNQRQAYEITIASLNTQLRDINHSLVWRAFTRYQRLLNSLLPLGSLRRQIYHGIIRGTVQPFLRVPLGPIPPQPPHNQSGGSQIPGQPPHSEESTLSPQEDARGNAPIDIAPELLTPQWQPLQFPDFSEIEVSIVIPVFNKGIMTSNCLQSILDHSTIAYEVVVIDNHSDVETSEILKAMGGIKLIRNTENKGFVEACNQGAAAACGKNILFLNNDTIVTANWLNAMLAPLEDATVALVGAKLLFPDGRLQEAGGIIWQDGTGWNYGREDDPSLPQYNYRKEVDYCSGACLLIRREIWRELGGFDLRYAPAYYEDTDLCFAARAKGYKVIYQPEAEIIHLEGASAGTDINKGFKRYQKINQEKFLDKWREVLKNNHFTGPESLYLARERGKQRRVVVIDHYAPTYDKDSGSLRMLTLLGILNSLNFKVIFWPHNLLNDQRYTRNLQRMGIEAIYGDLDFDYYCRQHGQDLDFIVLSRPHVSVDFIFAAKRLTRARIIYDTVDLHFLREERRERIEGIPASNEAKDMELFLINQADDVLVVSDVEKGVLERLGFSGKIALISNIHTVDKIDRPFSQRQGLMFIGGFDHTPNEDGIIWFVGEILPLIRKKLPGVCLTIVGSNPTERVKALAANGISVTGYVEDVRPYFAAARIFVCPLRYGAGVKGKIGQSMAYGLPVIMTSVGAEGLGISNGEEALIADSAQVFADKVIALYRDPERWEKLVQGGLSLIEKRFSPNVVRDALIELLDNTPGNK